MAAPSSLSVGEAWQYFQDALSGSFAPTEIRALGKIIFEQIFHLSQAQRILQHPDLLPEGSFLLLQQIVYKLKKNIPVQYITGMADFCDLKFQVDQRALIPRPETEELVEWVIREVNKRRLAYNTLNIVDVCTGSGCIAVSLAYHLKGSSVAACDISADALELASENARANGVVVDFFECNVLQKNIPIADVDIVVCNPPYVTPAEKLQMQSNVLDYEPHVALFVPADDPLIFYRAVARQSFRILKPQGLLFFEINEMFPNETSKIIQTYGFENVEIKEDFNGKPRFVFAQKPM